MKRAMLVRVLRLHGFLAVRDDPRGVGLRACHAGFRAGVPKNAGEDAGMASRRFAPRISWLRHRRSAGQALSPANAIATFFSIALYLSACSAWGAQRYAVTGIALRTDAAHRSFVASCAAIPGFMSAMVMPYTVRDAKALDGIQPGMQVEFTLVVEADRSYAEDIRPHRFESMEQEPQRARRLQLLEAPEGRSPEAGTLAQGQAVAGFALIDQTGKRVTLSQFAGKVVGITFIYTSCPLPDYCFRLSNNFGRLSKRFAANMGKDLVLLSITFDPAHDWPEVLAKYASTWKADPQSWHFLTGAPADVQAVCRQFGVSSWLGEGSLTHSLHTAVIDRRGRLAANFEGNEFTAEQLGDFVEATLESGR